MKILVICTHGKNRSKHLAEYLMQKGYDADYAGVNQSNQEEVACKVAGADIVITVHGSVSESLLEKFDLKGKRHIELDAEDRPEIILPDHRQLNGDKWTVFQKKYVYPKLEEQIGRFLPLGL